MSVPPEWMRGPADEEAVRQGCRFDPGEAERPVRFVEKFCRQSKAPWAGQLLALMDWQKDFLRRLYGWKQPDGTRRYRTFYLEVPKKNGKSTKISGLSLYHAVGDGEDGAEVYIAAYDKGQAGIVFGEAANMVASSPALSKVLNVVPSTKHIFHEKSRSKIQALSADVPSKDGFNASFTVFDELHRQRTAALWNILKYAGASRLQPLMGAITTAGYDRQSICFKRHEYTKKVNDGLIPDVSHLGVIYGAEPNDDIEDPAVWAKANPSLGVTIRADDFRRELREALENPSELNNFLRLRLNIWTNASERFLARDDWDACGKAPVKAHELAGRPCFGMLDLSSTTDVTAQALVFPDGSGGYDCLFRFWVPEESAERREERDRVPYRAWERQGFLTFTPGNVVDYAFVRAQVNRDAQTFDLRKLFCDPWNATQLALQLKEEDGLPVEFLRQGFLSLNAPTKELERLVMSGKIRHGDNPVMNWMADNAVSVGDAAGNVKLSKEKSTERIDGMAALVGALAAATTTEGGGGSVYDERDLVVF